MNLKNQVRSTDGGLFMYIKNVLLATIVAISFLLLFSMSYAVDTIYTYDELNRLTKVVRQDETGVTNYEYTYDKAGNLVFYTVSRTAALGLGDLIKILQIVTEIDKPVNLSELDLDNSGRLGLEDALMVLQSLGETPP